MENSIAFDYDEFIKGEPDTVHLLRGRGEYDELLSYCDWEETDEFVEYTENVGLYYSRLDPENYKDDSYLVEWKRLLEKKLFCPPGSVGWFFPIMGIGCQKCEEKRLESLEVG